MTDPVEKAFAALCHKYDIAFARPEQDRSSKSTLDFYLLDVGLPVEVKQFPTPRLHDQITRSGEKNVMILIGRGAIEALDKLLGRTESEPPNNGTSKDPLLHYPPPDK